MFRQGARRRWGLYLGYAAILGLGAAAIGASAWIAIAIALPAGVHLGYAAARMRETSAGTASPASAAATTEVPSVLPPVPPEGDARATYDRLLELADTIHEAFWIADPANAKMLYVSPGYEKVFGRSRASLYQDPRDFLNAVHPDDRSRVEGSFARPITGPTHDHYRILMPDGATRSIAIRLVPVRDAAGKLVRLAGVAEDVTERLQLEDQVRQTQKLESLGLLAGGVAHDFNNILAVIGANAGLLTETLPMDHPDRELVDDIEAAVRRATSLTRQLLSFSRKQVIAPVVLDMNVSVDDTSKMLRRMVGDDVVFESSLEPELGSVRIDPGYLIQVMMNLAVNARDAMPRGGKLTFSTRNVDKTHEVLLSVTDTGAGMTPEVQARVFEPFFTTKGVGKGTGLGLSVVHGIVQQAGGRIEIKSAVGKGTTIRVYLPRVDAPAEATAIAVAPHAHGSERILLVDDDVFIRTAASRALRALGYQVLEASDGPAALRLLGDAASAISLLLTDVVMPGMNGRELVEAARRRRPSLKVLYMSGYADDAVLNHGLHQEDVAFVEKPFHGHSLAGKVRAVLDAPEPSVARAV